MCPLRIVVLHIGHSGVVIMSQGSPGGHGPLLRSTMHLKKISEKFGSLGFPMSMSPWLPTKPHMVIWIPMSSVLGPRTLSSTDIWPVTPVWTSSEALLSVWPVTNISHLTTKAPYRWKQMCLFCDRGLLLPFLMRLYRYTEVLSSYPSFNSCLTVVPFLIH